MRLFSRKQRGEDHLNRAMRDLAGAFMTTCAQEGRHLDVSIESARQLDAVIDHLLVGDPTPALVQAVTQGTAAFLGEVVVRAGKAEWALEPGTEDVVLVMLPDGVPVIHPVVVVDNRLRLGPTRSLSAFVDTCLAGFTRPADR